MQEAANWVIDEANKACFGDKRLDKRYKNLLSEFSYTPDKSIPASFKSWSETLAAYRFMNHKKVTHTRILSPHKEATLERIKGQKVVLVAQDTTEMDFTKRKSMRGMGYLSKGNSKGFYLHPSIALTPERCCLGVIDVQMWVREELGTREKRKKKPIEEKETYCWVKSYEAANQIALAAPETTIVNVGDREGDIYELLEKLPSEENKAYWLVRSSHNRSILNDANQKFELRLREMVRKAEAIGHVEFKMSGGMSNRNSKSRHKREERNVYQEVRICNITLRPPRRKEKKLEPISINVVHCKEINCPAGEEALEWFLLTSFPVKDAEGALDIVQWYLCRWQIEVYFKVLKSGCKVEELQFDTFEATANCLAFYMIVGWRILYLTMLGRACPDMECSAVFEASEWQSVYRIVKKEVPPKKPPKLNEMILMIAKLGGFLGRKSDGYPGTQVMWIGIQRMRDFTLAWEAFRS